MLRLLLFLPYFRCPVRAVYDLHNCSVERETLSSVDFSSLPYCNLIVEKVSEHPTVRPYRTNL